MSHKHEHHTHEEDLHGSCGCHHHHEHNPQSKWIFIAGIISFVIGLFVHVIQPIIGNVLFFLTVVLAGQHVITEGLMETIEETREAKRFRPNVHLLMTLAAIGAMLIGKFEEAALLIVIFAGAHFLEEYVEEKSRKEITHLLEMQPKMANRLLADGSIEEIHAEDIHIGDFLQVKSGDILPSDGVITNGSTLLNEASVTGESMPEEKTIGDIVYAGTINDGNTITIEVTKEQKDTIFAKIVQLVEESQRSLTKTATFIKRVEPVYVSIVLALFPIVLLIAMFVLGWDWSTAFYRGMVYLIAVSPCALAASATPTTLASISYLSKQGVLIKGGAALSLLNDLNVIAFDKTGTLTTGNPHVLHVVYSQEEEWINNILVSMESQANHPLAKAIVRDIPASQLIPVEVNNELGIGISAMIDGKLYRIAKPTVFTFSQKWQEIVEQWSNEGKTVVMLAQEDTVIAAVALMDTAKEEASQAIEYFNQEGIQTVLLTGDSVATGQAIAQQLGISQVKANIMPEEKAAIIQQLQQSGVVAMVGDGVNDAPALARADIGIAMGNGTDVAIEVSDFVMTKEDLGKLTLAHQVAKKMTRITKQNIAFAMGIVVLLVLMNFLGISDITWGVILHEGSTLLVILNALRMLHAPKVR